MQRLFWGEKYLSELYADGTFREVFVPEQDMRRIIYSLIKFRGRPGWMGYPEWKNILWTVHSSTSRGHFFARGRPVARTDPNFAASFRSGKEPI